jgi:cystathionine beta-lyase/cystathionine gamma-synthase
VEVEKGLARLRSLGPREGASAEDRKLAAALAPGVDLGRNRCHRAERARRLLRGFSGVLSFELQAGAEEADTFIGRLRLPLYAVSLGGVETLVTRPANTSHAGLSAEEREEAGIADRLIRLAVGIESPADLIADFGQSLVAVAA